MFFTDIDGLHLNSVLLLVEEAFLPRINICLPAVWTSLWLSVSLSPNQEVYQLLQSAASLIRLSLKLGLLSFIGGL